MARRVLIIDDEAETCRMLSTALELFGFETAFALSGLEALDMMNGFKPEAIVLDLMMPGIDGFEVARRVRANPQTQSVPIVVVTAMGEASAEQRAREAGATEFMHKPIGIAELADAIKKLTN